MGQESGEILEQYKRELVILWLGVILASSSYTMVVPFLPLYLFELGGSADTVNMWSGLVFSVTFFVGAIMAPYWGALADRYGKRKMAIRSGLCLAVVYFFGAFVRSPLELLAVRILQGFSSGFVPASIALVASSAPKERMGWSLGIMQTASSTGGILGPLFGGVLSHFFGMRLSFVAAALGVFLATIAVLMFVKEGKSVAETTASNVLSDLKVASTNHVLLMMLGLLLVVQVAVMIRQPFITLYVTNLQGRLEGAVLSSGIIFSLIGVAGIIAAPFWGNIGQKKGFINILIIVFSGAGLINIAHLFIKELWQFGLLQFIFGLFLAGIYPTINTIVVTCTDSDFRGRAFGLTTTANQIGQMIGPALGGIASSWMSIPLIFVCTGVVLVITSIISWCKLKDNP